MNNNFKLICFDMDGTLIRNTNSVRYLCKLNGTEQKALDIESQEMVEMITRVMSDVPKNIYDLGIQ